MFRVVRVWDDGDSSTFRYTKPKFDTRLDADTHRLKLQNRFPKYLFWISEGDVRSNTVRLTKHDDLVPMSNDDFIGEADLDPPTRTTKHPDPPWDD